MIDEITQVVGSIHEAAAALRLAVSRNPLPLDKVFWTREDCAHFLQYTSSIMRKRVEKLPEYPKAHRTGGRGQPRWIAAEVIDWAQDQ